jgi:hypothetical protein
MRKIAPREAIKKKEKISPFKIVKKLNSCLKIRHLFFFKKTLYLFFVFDA